MVLHEAGCPSGYWISDYAFYLYEKPHLPGLVYIVFGLLVGMCGKKAYSTVVPTTVIVFIVLHFMAIPVTFLAAGQSLAIFLVSIIVLAALTLVAVWLLHKYKYVGVTLTLIAIMIGYLFGEFVFAIIFTITGQYSFSSYLCITFVFVIICGVYAIVKRKNFSDLTSILALACGLMISRGMSLTIGGFPTDAANLTFITHDYPPEIKKIVWAYFLGALGISIVFLCWLSLYKLEHCDLALNNYYEWVEKDDDTNFVRAKTFNEYDR